MVAYHRVPEYVYAALAKVDLVSERTCNEHLLEVILEGENPKCPVCGSDKLYVDKKHFGIYKCKNKECRYSFSAYQNTFLHGTKVLFRKWLALICTYYKFGAEFKITTRAYAVGLGLTPPTTTLMLEKIKSDERVNKLARKIYTATNVSSMRHYLDYAWEQLDERVKAEHLKRRKRSE
jgi:transposase-like protein